MFTVPPSVQLVTEPVSSPTRPPIRFLSNIYYHDFSGTVVTNDDITAATVYALNLPQGVKASGGNDYKVTINGVDFYKSGATVTLTLAEGVDVSKIRILINGQAVTPSDGTYQFEMEGGDISVDLFEENLMTQQDVIKAFTAKLANHSYAYSDDVGTKMLNAAVRASSRFAGIQEVIDAMKADQIKAEKLAVKEIFGEEKLLSELTDEQKNQLAKNNDVAKSLTNGFYNGASSDSANGMTVESVIKERKAYIFLEKCCGIQLSNRYWFNGNGSQTYYNGGSGLTGNVDTGAIPARTRAAQPKKPTAPSSPKNSTPTPPTMTPRRLSRPTSALGLSTPPTSTTQSPPTAPTT